MYWEGVLAPVRTSHSIVKDGLSNYLGLLLPDYDGVFVGGWGWFFDNCVSFHQYNFIKTLIAQGMWIVRFGTLIGEKQNILQSYNMKNKSFSFFIAMATLLITALSDRIVPLNALAFNEISPFYDLQARLAVKQLTTTPPLLGNNVKGESNSVRGVGNVVQGKGNIAIGKGNIMLGDNGQIFGLQNTMMGNRNRIEKGNQNLILGIQNLIKGSKNMIIGQLNMARGNENSIMGQRNFVIGDRNNVVGSQNSNIGKYNQIIGHNNSVSGMDNYVIGKGSSLIGDMNINMGDGNKIVGDHNLVKQSGNSILGEKNGVEGKSNSVYGNQNKVQGNNNSLMGSKNFVYGSDNVVVDGPLAGLEKKLKKLEGEMYNQQMQIAISRLNAVTPRGRAGSVVWPGGGLTNPASRVY